MNNSFARPMFELEDPDVSVTLMKRQIPQMELKDLVKFKDMDFYCLGTFDDETGEFRSSVQMLIGFDSFLPVIRQKEMEAKFASMEAVNNEQEKVETVE